MQIIELIGVIEFKALLTEPLEAAVVLIDQKALCAIPKRASLPSMFMACISGIMPKSKASTNKISMAAKIAHPCLLFLIIKPNEKQSAIGKSRIKTFSTMFVNGVGFSYGLAAFAALIPPPFVPLCLMAI